MNIGTQVSWESQSSGTRKSKKGIVIAIIPKKTWATEWLKGVSKSRIKGQDLNEVNDRALVAVPRGGKSLLYDLYTPNVNWLKEKPRTFTEEEQREAFFQLKLPVVVVQTEKGWDIRVAASGYVIDTLPTKEQAVSMCGFKECRIAVIQEQVGG